MRVLFDIALAIALVGTGVASVFLVVLLWGSFYEDTEGTEEDRYEVYQGGYDAGFEDGHYEGRVVASDDADRASTAN